MAFRTSRLRAQRGFDARLGPGTPSLGGDDVDVMMRIIRAGGTLVHVPRALVAPSRPSTSDERTSIAVERGAGVSAIFAKNLLNPVSAFGLMWRLATALFERALRSSESDPRPRRDPRDEQRRYRRGLATGWFGYLRAVVGGERLAQRANQEASPR